MTFAILNHPQQLIGMKAWAQPATLADEFSSTATLIQRLAVNLSDEPMLITIDLNSVFAHRFAHEEPGIDH